MTTSRYVVILIIITGYIFLKKETFARTFLIFTFAIILNPFLKSLFQVPLPPTAGSDGWAFPSGHMLTATIFWTWLAWEYKNRNFSLFVAVLLTSYGIALVYFGYHYPLDIVGALFFAFITLCLYHYLLKLPILNNTPPLVGFILATIGILLIFLIPNATQRSFIWVGFGSLLGFSLGWLFVFKSSYQNTFSSLKIKLSIFILSLLGLFAIEGLFLLINSKSWPTRALHYSILALWLSAIAQAITIKLFTQNRSIHSLSPISK